LQIVENMSESLTVAQQTTRSVLATTADAQVSTEEPTPQTGTSRMPLFKPDYSNLDPFAKLLCADLGSDNEKDVEAALHKIEYMCLYCNTPDEDQKNRDLFAALGGHLGIVLVLRKWTSRPGIQGAGCRALYQILSEMTTEVRDVAVQVGALETVLAAMKNFPKHEYVQINGCGAMCCFSDSIYNTEHLVWKLDGLRYVASAMKEFPENINLQMWGCKLFSHIGNRDEFKATAIRAGGLEVLFTAAMKHSCISAARDALEKLS
jgi:hypothetical protein